MNWKLRDIRYTQLTPGPPCNHAIVINFGAQRARRLISRFPCSPRVRRKAYYADIPREGFRYRVLIKIICSDYLAKSMSLTAQRHRYFVEENSPLSARPTAINFADTLRMQRPRCDNILYM